MKTSAALQRWLKSIQTSRSKNTFKTCQSAANAFMDCIPDMPVEKLSDCQYSKFVKYIKTYHSPSTEKLYATLIYLFYEFLAVKRLSRPDVLALKYVRRYETRRPGTRLREIDKASLAQIDRHLGAFNANTLVLARAKAWAILAIESGLRASELCKLRRSNFNFLEMYGRVIGKGDRERKFYFTERSINAIKDYHSLIVAETPDKFHGVPERSRPIFISHSKRHAKVVKQVDYDTALRDVNMLVSLLLSRDPEYKITPHVFRHYNVTAVLDRTGNTALAQKEVGHASISTTAAYIHVDDEEVQKAHREIFGGRR